MEAVNNLDQNGFIPKDCKPWVDHIRNKGNEANHEIVIMSKEDAKNLLTFMEMLLRMMYEFPAKMTHSMSPDVQIPEDPEHTKRKIQFPV